jgi:CsoR family transcriptional regulator, copper-sensing transcriptional repressor
MIEPYKSKAAIGGKKALGQLKKVLSMIEDDAYCMDVIQQIRAVQGLLHSVAAQSLDSHLHTCANRAFSSDDKKEQEKIIQELVGAFKASKK